jgi:hypothetical protein
MDSISRMLRGTKRHLGKESVKVDAGGDGLPAPVSDFRMLLSIALLAAQPLPVRPPIVRRHDRPDSAYVALARQFPMVGSFGRIGGGTLIDARWVVTAAHVGRGVLRRMQPKTFTIGGREYAVDTAFIHEQWTELGAHDVALVRLREPVVGIAPAKLFTASNERGQIAYFVGNGRTGVGTARQKTDDDVWRAATSRIDSTNADALFFSFDQGAGATELEGAPAGGDSGGPALLRVGSDVFVAGISSAGFDGATGPATYGAIDVYTRVSTHVAWIERLMRDRK